MTNIKKRHFCKSVALLSLVPLLKINFLSANTNVQNSVLSGSVIINGKKVSKNSDLDFDQITDVETGNQLSLIKNDQDGFLVRPNSKLVFYKNKIRELVQGSIHGVFGKTHNWDRYKTQIVNWLNLNHDSVKSVIDCITPYQIKSLKERFQNYFNDTSTTEGTQQILTPIKESAS